MAETTSSTSEYLQSLSSIRERCGLLASHGESLEHFTLNTDKIDGVVEYVIALMSRDYGSVDEIPPHSRWRHFDAGGVKRVDGLIATWRAEGVGIVEVVTRLLDLFVVGVLLDAGAGAEWKLKVESEGTTYTRSEGLALASLGWFQAGGFSGSRGQSGGQSRVDAEGLLNVTSSQLETYFQVTSQNPLVGVKGRTGLLNRLGTVLQTHPRFFEFKGSLRPGNIIHFLVPGLADSTRDPVDAHNLPVHAVPIDKLWEVVVTGFSGVWPPTRSSYDSKSLGDVWPCRALASIHSNLRTTANTSANASKTLLALDPAADALLPFHKLSQWLTYSLMEPLALLNIIFPDASKMTGLAEYRNGGLFIDMSVITLKSPAAVANGVNVYDDLVVEWRGLTVALLDIVAERVRKQLGLTEAQLPLAKVLEAGMCPLFHSLFCFGPLIFSLIMICFTFNLCMEHLHYISVPHQCLSFWVEAPYFHTPLSISHRFQRLLFS